jgi:hypothetical protein
MREIKFRVISGNKIIGYERLTKGAWEWMCPELNPDNGERWTRGCFPDNTGEKHSRDQFTCLKDNGRNDIYEGDTLEVETKGKIFRGVVKWNVQSASFIVINEKHYLEIISCAASSDSNEYIVLDQAEIIGKIYENP